MQQKSALIGLFSLFLMLCCYYFWLIQNTELSSSCSDKLQVVCTTTLIADAIEHIAKDTIQLNTLMQPGIDPHTYKPIEQDIIKIAQADIIFYHGLHLEARMSDLFDSMKTYKKVINISQTIPKSMLIFDPQFTDHADPHIWFDPELWSLVVKNIAQHLQLLIPEHAQTYETNKNDYLQKIILMHQNNQKVVAQIPINQRILITGHDAFSYFARAYHFQVFGLQGINTATQAGTKDVQNIVQIIINHQIKTIFPENSIPTRNMQSLLQSVQMQGAQVNIGHELFSDSLGPENTIQASYIGMMQSNVENIVQGLQDLT